MRFDTAVREEKALKPVNLLQAVRFFRDAWDLVRVETVLKCFRLAFPECFASGESIEEEQEEEIILSPQVAKEVLPPSVTLQDYLHADENLLMGEIEQRSWGDSEIKEVLVVA